MAYLSDPKKISHNGFNIIDFSVLLKLSDNDMDLSKSLLKKFMDDTGKQKSLIKEAYNNNQNPDIEQLHHHIHKLSGSASLCGLSYIKHAATDILDLLYEKNTDALDHYMALLFKAIDETIKTYEQSDYSA